MHASCDPGQTVERRTEEQSNLRKLGVAAICLLLSACSGEERISATATAQPVVPADISALIQGKAKRDQWYENYYRKGPDGRYLPNPQCRGAPDTMPCYDIIAMTAKGRETAEASVANLTRKFPDIAFQLWTTQQPDTYAIIAAIGLSRQEAVQLTDALQARGLNARFWRWPKFSDKSDLIWPWS